MGGRCGWCRDGHRCPCETARSSVRHPCHAAAVASRSDTRRSQHRPAGTQTLSAMRPGTAADNVSTRTACSAIPPMPATTPKSMICTTRWRQSATVTARPSTGAGLVLDDRVLLQAWQLRTLRRCTRNAVGSGHPDRPAHTVPTGPRTRPPRTGARLNVGFTIEGVVTMRQPAPTLTGAMSSESRSPCKTLEAWCDQTSRPVRAAHRPPSQRAGRSAAAALGVDGRVGLPDAQQRRGPGASPCGPPAWRCRSQKFPSETGIPGV